ncbi:MAG: ComF family protein [Sneathiella sp.]
MSVSQFINQMQKTVLDAVFPPGCVNCAEPIDTPGNLCGRCWPEMTYISAPFCDICGYPFEYYAGDGMICAACLKRPPAYSKARAVLKYDEASRDMILGYKHSDQTNRAPTFAQWMYRAGMSLIEDCDVICPVPLHRQRLIRRRYNQSAMLAGELSKLSGKPAILDLITRKRQTRTQGGLSARARFRNVRGAFDVNPARGMLLEGARVLLIDDVLTTGATVEACSKCLLGAGALNVDILTFSRVVRAANTTI